MRCGQLEFARTGWRNGDTNPHKKIDQGSAMVANREERIAELGKLLKGKIQTDWTLLDEAYREPFDELMAATPPGFRLGLHDSSSGQAQDGSGAQ
jgi:hypothetical protein